MVKKRGPKMGQKMTHFLAFSKNWSLFDTLGYRFLTCFFTKNHTSQNLPRKEPENSKNPKSETLKIALFRLKNWIVTTRSDSGLGFPKSTFFEKGSKKWPKSAIFDPFLTLFWPLKSRCSKSDKTSPESSGDDDKSEKTWKKGQKMGQKWSKNDQKGG